MAEHTPAEIKRNQRVEQLAKGYYGQALIDWLDEIVTSYADVRSIKQRKLTMETGYEVVQIIENELLTPLKQWRNLKKGKLPVSGDNME